MAHPLLMQHLGVPGRGHNSAEKERKTSKGPTEGQASKDVTGGKQKMKKGRFLLRFSPVTTTSETNESSPKKGKGIPAEKQG